LALAAAVGVEHGILGEQMRQRRGIAARGGGAEGLRHPLALGGSDGEARPGLAHMLARPRRQLPTGGLAAAQCPGDLGKSHLEDVVQQEGGALERRQALQRQHQRVRPIG